METPNDAGVSAIAEDRSEEMIRIEIEREGAVELITLEVQDREDLLHTCATNSNWMSRS